MNSNEILAQMAGITPIPPVSVQDEDDSIQYEDENFDDMEVPDPFETEKKSRQRTVPRGRNMLQRELQGLQFRNPGDEMSRYLPDSADIISTNRSRRQRVEKRMEPKEDPIHHDAEGALVVNTRGKTHTYDLCDCLNTNCNGCHWPCKSCKSTKCFITCRRGRKDMIVKIEEMYTMEGATEHVVTTNKHYPYQIKD